MSEVLDIFGCPGLYERRIRKCGRLCFYSFYGKVIEFVDCFGESLVGLFGSILVEEEKTDKEN